MLLEAGPWGAVRIKGDQLISACLGFSYSAMTALRPVNSPVLGQLKWLVTLEESESYLSTLPG